MVCKCNSLLYVIKMTAKYSCTNLLRCIEYIFLKGWLRCIEIYNLAYVLFTHVIVCVIFIDPTLLLNKKNYYKDDIKISLGIECLLYIMTTSQQ